ncbi:MAG: YeeE/YedE thiosulfate transporter family protein [Kiritimatiellae bacterium]|jgi:uncharacterized membrane protein YedE/YeeE|nr:YeeE/YedE thiosulfate transporter family protein [Kiritimatiellia bacterium]
MELILGAATGVIFGFLLQKAEVLRFEKQVGFLLLRDVTILKFMLSAILVGAIGIYACHDLGLIELKIKVTTLAPLVTGGVLFGVGWAIAGYCPGTSLGAIGEGRIHAIWVVLGMLTGAALYAEVYPHLSRKFMKLYDYGKITVPDITGLNHWIVIAILGGIILFMFFLFERK